MQEILKSESFNELLSLLAFGSGLIFGIVSIFHSEREYLLRITAIFLVVSVSLFANNAYCYFASIFIIATAVTQLDFLQNLAAIIRGSKEYFDYKKETIPVNEIEKSKEEEIEEAERISEKKDKDSNLLDIQSSALEHSNLSGRQFFLLVENQTFRYLEKKYRQPIEKYQRIISNGRNVVEFDGIISTKEFDIILELKASRRTLYPAKFLKEMLERQLEGVREYKRLSKKRVEFKLIFVGELRESSKDRIKKLIKEMNTENTDIQISVDLLTFEDIDFKTDITDSNKS
ncbi:hypothetical protein [Ekhidna sp.]